MWKYLAFFLVPTLCAANATGLVVDAACENKVPHGNYFLKSGSGLVRIEGRYSQGLRDGEFTFYGADGERLIVLPYSNGLIDGTVRAWYAQGAADGEGSGPRPKLAADISAGFVNGRHQTWYENGNPRSDFVVDDGEIASAETWNPDGSELEIGSDAAFLQTEIESDFEYYGRLEQVLDAYPPACES